MITMPETPATDWNVDPRTLDAREAYHLLTGLVLPRPIGWVSTVDGAGRRNLAPFGYYNMCSHDPPVLHITDSGSHTDTLRNIRETGVFVCNVVSYDLVEAMNFTAVPFPPEEDEFDWAGLSAAPSFVVAAPRVAEARAAIAADLDEMERMLDQTLAYLRGDRADEEFKAIDVAAILETIVDDASDRGHAVTLTRAEHVSVPGRRLALKRAFGNLIDNALKYGREALITVEDQSETVIVSIRDQGPGIAPEDIPRALAPFVRLEPSRNQETGGFGLGLTIAQAIVEGHGGQLTLANHVAGGLVVSVHLPKKQRPA